MGSFCTKYSSPAAGTYEKKVVKMQIHPEYECVAVDEYDAWESWNEWWHDVMWFMMDI